MKTIKITGYCNKKGCCCKELDFGNVLRNMRGQQQGCNCDGKEIPEKTRCKFLMEDGRCLYLEKIREGKSETELRQIFGEDYCILEYMAKNRGCRLDFPQPADFGYFEETPNYKYAGGRDDQIKNVVDRFNEWKKRTGCTYSFEVVE